MKYRIIENSLKECGDISDEQLAIITYIARKQIEEPYHIHPYTKFPVQWVELKREDIQEMRRLGLLKSHTIDSCAQEVEQAIEVKIVHHEQNEKGEKSTAKGRLAAVAERTHGGKGRFLYMAIVIGIQVIALALDIHEYEAIGEAERLIRFSIKNPSNPTEELYYEKAITTLETWKEIV